MDEHHKPGDAGGGFHIDFGAAREGARVLFDGQLYWRVYELPPPPYDRRRGPSLVFEHEVGMRRVRHFPADWRSLDDAALLEYANGV